MILHRLGADMERLGNVVVRHIFVTAHAEHLTSLLGHIAHRQVDHLHQVVRRYAVVGIGRRLRPVLRSPGLVFRLHLPVFEGIENGVARHPEKIPPERHDVAQGLALLPHLEENIVCNILGLNAVAEQPKRKVPDFRGITQVKNIESLGIPFPQFPQQDMFVAIHGPFVQI